MAENILLNIAESLLKNLGSRALGEVASTWGFKTRLEKLSNTVSMIKDVLSDAEERQVESHVVHGWLERLSAAVYAADDLFDEFATLALQREDMSGSKVAKEVCTFFSESNQIVFAYNISKKIKNIREELDGITKDSSEFGFVLRPREEGGMIGRQLRKKTHSYVHAEEIIGREDEKMALIKILVSGVSPCSAADKAVLSVVPIVGIGGLGKTTLAQLAYKDKQIDRDFKLKLWVCVDQVFDVEEILRKILMSAKNAKTPIPNIEMDQLQRQLHQEISGKKYLLVLDDVWNENPEKWLELRDLLMVGKDGSTVLVTTRSLEVAYIMGTVRPYELKGLSEEKSWELFEKMAFEPEDVQRKRDLVELGKEIVKKCAAVPLAIRSLGSLLRGKDERKWLSIHGTSLAELPQNQNNITPILKLSYHHLWSPLKNCFAYCALFPKDYRMPKQTLIELWMAQGFITPEHESHGLEDIAEEYFMMLLQRCFFQDTTKDEWGNIVSCKMHDLMHDLALEVAGDKIRLAKFEDKSFSAKVRHCSFAYSLTSSWEITRCMRSMKHLRTFLLPKQVRDGSNFNKSLLRQLMSNFRCLRSLDLKKLGVTSLPKSIGKLIHLRYLNLSLNPIAELPHSITRLQNLQTLKLNSCHRLKLLPINIRNLTNLRRLELDGCDLKHMPSGIGELTSLCTLSLLMVANTKHTTAQLRDLENLNNIEGYLRIEVMSKLENPVSEANEANLIRKCFLTELNIQLACGNYEDDIYSKHDEAILEGLQPHPNLRMLEISFYKGQKLPSWAMNDKLSTNLPKLVEIQLRSCGTILELPSFGKLPFLKRLILNGLESVEYVDSSLTASQHSSASPADATFFPSLQELTLDYMDRLKGWWSETEAVFGDTQQDISKQSYQHHLLSLSFPKLDKLLINYCPNLVAFPLCPSIEELDLLDVNVNLLVLKKFTGSVTKNEIGTSKLKSLSIDNVEDLIAMPKECLARLSSLDIRDSKLLDTFKLGEVFSNLSSLRCLTFYNCGSLRSVSDDLKSLTALEKLVFQYCDELDLSANEQIKDEDGMTLPWNALKKLNSLELVGIPKLENLPSGLQHLTNLRSLEIRNNCNLEAIPEWISHFTSLDYIQLKLCSNLTSLPEGFCKLTNLNRLLIEECPGLTKRCRSPNGSEWPKIQHIPYVSVLESVFY